MADLEREARIGLGPELQDIAVQAITDTLVAGAPDAEELSLGRLDMAELKERHHRAAIILHSELETIPSEERAYTEQQAAVRAMIRIFRVASRDAQPGRFMPGWFENIRHLGVENLDELALGRAFHIELISAAQPVTRRTVREITASILNHQLAFLAHSDERFHGGFLTTREVHQDSNAPDTPYGFNGAEDSLERRVGSRKYLARLLHDWLERRRGPKIVPVDTPDK